MFSGLKEDCLSVVAMLSHNITEQILGVATPSTSAICTRDRENYF